MRCSRRLAFHLHELGFCKSHGILTLVALLHFWSFELSVGSACQWKFLGCASGIEERVLRWFKIQH